MAIYLQKFKNWVKRMILGDYANPYLRFVTQSFFSYSGLDGSKANRFKNFFNLFAIFSVASRER